MEDTEFRTVLEHISDGVLFIDHDGVIRLYNGALVRMFSIDRDLHGIQIFSLRRDYPLRQGIFRVDKAFRGPYCWESRRCPATADCPELGSKCCRCWILGLYGTACGQGIVCLDCAQFTRVKEFLEKPKELEIGDKVISVLSTFIELRDTGEIWEVILFRDATFEKLDAVVKLAGATAHEMRQPLQAIVAILTLMRNDPEATGSHKYLDVIYESCIRMDRIIRNIGHITRYRTKRYVDDRQILDIDESSRDPDAQ